MIRSFLFWRRERDGFLQKVRNFIFGVEDSLVSTVGLLSGVASAGSSRTTIIMTGVVLIFVEAFSMGVGSFLSESATQEYGTKRSARRTKDTIVSSLIMLVSYFGAGLIPLSPYVFFEGSTAFTSSILASLCSLAILGMISARVLKIGLVTQSIRMFLMGGFAIALGVCVGALFV